MTAESPLQPRGACLHDGRPKLAHRHRRQCTHDCENTGLYLVTSPCMCPQDVWLQRTTHATQCCQAAFRPLPTRPRPASKAGALHAYPFRHADVCAVLHTHPPPTHPGCTAPRRLLRVAAFPAVAQGGPAGRPVQRREARRRSPDLLQHEQLAAALRHPQVPHILSRRLCEALAGMLHRRLGPGLLHQYAALPRPSRPSGDPARALRSGARSVTSCKPPPPHRLSA